MTQLEKKYQKLIKNIPDAKVRRDTAVLLENQMARRASRDLFGLINEDSAANTLPATAIQDPYRPGAANTFGQEGKGGYGIEMRGGNYPILPFALVRRSHPLLFANKLVGVQPMKGPSGIALSLKFLRNDKDFDSSNPTEAGWQEVEEYSGYTGRNMKNTSRTDTSAAFENGWGDAAVDGDPNAYQKTGAGQYSETQSGSYGWGAKPEDVDYWTVNGSGGEPNYGAATFGPNGLSRHSDVIIDWSQVPIYAYGRSSAASFSPSTIEDIDTLHNIDIQRETLNHLQYLLVAELDRETIGRVKACAYRAAIQNKKWFIKSFLPQYASESPDFTYTLDLDKITFERMAERSAVVINALVRACGDIGNRNLRAEGNVVVVTRNILNIIQSAPVGMYTANTANIKTNELMPKVGTINGNIDVYVDRYNRRDDVCIAAYVGDRAGDAGLFYCPYLTGIENRAIDPRDWSTKIGVRMRYAFAKSLLGEENYYSTVAFRGANNLLIGAPDSTYNVNIVSG